MLARIVEELKCGNHAVVDMFMALEAMWMRRLGDIEHVSEAELGERIVCALGEAEEICRDAFLAKAMLPLSAFAHLYSCEFGYRDDGRAADKLAAAFRSSTCGVELKQAARQAAHAYYVGDGAGSDGDGPA